jgi:two-component system cell cycle response regulator CtrA
MSTVLIIEDDPATADGLQLIFSAAGIKCHVVRCGEEGLEIGKLYNSRYDLVILDLLLPDMHGYEVLQRLRCGKIKIPVLILSGLSEIEQKIKGLGYGADDYMTKPFNRGELLARVHAIIRRSKGHAESVLRFDRVCINLDSRTVEVNGKIVRLTSKEYAILELLAMRKGTVLTKEMCLDHLYGGMDEPEFKIIDVFVCKLRKKLFEASGGQNYIETVWGRGYMLRDYSDTPSASLQKAEMAIAKETY